MVTALRRLWARLRAWLDERVPDREPGHSGWDYVPAWQYDGRFAEAGGLTRDEQETAIRDVQEQAAESERHARK